MANKRIIVEVLTKMQEYFGKTLKPDIIEIYIEHLAGMNEDKFKTASARIMLEFEQTSVKPFPLIRDFLLMSGEDIKSKAINVITAVKRAAENLGQYESVDFGDPALHSVIRRYGGWIEIVMWGEKDWQLHERNFIEAYKSAVLSELKENYCKGLHEISNGLNGFDRIGPYMVCNKTGKVLKEPEKIKQLKTVFVNVKQLEHKTGESNYDIKGDIRGIIARNNFHIA